MMKIASCLCAAAINLLAVGAFAQTKSLAETGALPPEALESVRAVAGEKDAYVVYIVKAGGATSEALVTATDAILEKSPERRRIGRLSLLADNPDAAGPELKALLEMVGERKLPTVLVFDSEGLLVDDSAGYIDGLEGRTAVATELAVHKRYRWSLSRPSLNAGRGAIAMYGSQEEAQLVGKEAPKIDWDIVINPVPEMEGKFLLVDIWATWCGPCIYSLDISEGLHKKFDDRLVSVAVTHEDERTVRRFVTGKKWTQPVVIQSSGAFSQENNVRSIPFAYLVNPDGVVVWQGHPMELWDKDGAKLDSLLSE